MAVELKIPDVGESIQEVQIGRWLKQEGDSVAEDENLVELESEKASMELPAPADGVLSEIIKHEGDTAKVGEVIGRLSDQAEGDGRAEEDESAESQRDHAAEEEEKPSRGEEPKKKKKEAEEEPKRRKAQHRKAPAKAETEGEPETAGAPETEEVLTTPSARRALREHGLSATEVQFSGERLRAEDVRRHVAESESRGKSKAADAEPSPAAAETVSAEEADGELEKTVPMSFIRRRIGERLVEAQQKAALLTTFNEIDMSKVVDLRKSHGERFREKYDIKLGFMSFFVKAAVDALRQFPELNAVVKNSREILYRNYYHIGVAIGAEEGLVVPVLRNAERLSFADIERAIDDFARRARDRKLEPDELAGGTFTISNGGIYGSLLSTPIVNPPQSGVLGMHAIQDRPVARNGEVVIRPMMYVALTYDHRIVDGREAVKFLKRITEAIEDPSRMLIEV